jgi:hypothetical protein
MTHSARTLRAPVATRLALAAALAVGASSAFAQAAPTQAQLLLRVDALARELEQVKAQLQQLASATASAPTAPAATPTVPMPTPSALTAPAATPTPPLPLAGAAEPATVLSSYGEISWLRPRDPSQSTADVSRFVIGLQHRFDDRTKMASELEVEHAVSSADDQGEVEVEQLYVERRLTDTYGLRAGLVLMPVGLLNANHEPTAYYGVARNLVETAIIPSTWREGGLQLFGEHANGVSWTAGLTTGFDLTKWDATASEGRESPLASIHQEMQLAHSRDLAVSASVDWRGMPGLRLGASGFTGGASQGQAGFASPHARVSLFDVHAQWTPGPWDVSALWTQGRIAGAGALNTMNAGASTPVPKRFDGWYGQVAYRWQLGDDAVLAPFARYEHANTGRGFDGLPVGVDPGAYATEAVRTLGVNWLLNPNVVLKADLQRYRLDTSRDRVGLGLGYSF